MKTPLQILTDARALIDSPEKWTKNADARDANGEEIGVYSVAATCFCAYGAIERASEGRMGHTARAFLRDSIPSEWDRKIEQWNDSPQRTHAEVLAGLDTAIELARNEEAK